MVNKKIIVIAMTLGAMIGSVVPLLFGDQALLDGWSVLGGFIGGLVGIIVGARLGRRFL